MALLLGYDAGSSSIKAALLEAETGELVVSATSPSGELEIAAPRPGWAEQDPETWWRHLKLATAMLNDSARADLREVKAVGISYQMHGLVAVDRALKPLRPAIIWCDSRAVPIGDVAFHEIGEETCLGRLLNSPGNFTASKLRWVREKEPEIYNKIYKVMLPGDYLGARMTGEVFTTPSGLSEMILWDYQREGVADFIMKHYGISPDLLPEVVPTFAEQGNLLPGPAEELGLRPGTPVTYRAGDQPNNAFSLKALNPGEAAATVGTSGVIYGVMEEPRCDPESRVNVFVHVNHRGGNPRYGMLLCVNGAGILNRWMKRNLAGDDESWDYPVMNELAAQAPVGSLGLLVLPYGNGAERTLGNRDIGASFHGMNLNLHTRSHILRAAQEGIVFALQFGLEIMRSTGLEVQTVRAGRANMFLSPLFGEAFAAVTGTQVELYDTDGAQGAARGAGLGAGIYHDSDEAFVGLKRLTVIDTDTRNQRAYGEAYLRWRKVMMRCLG
jgi:xylulokinase